MRLRALVLAVAIVLASAAAVQAERADTSTPALRQLALLPDVAPLHREVLLGDLARLRAAYPDPRAFAAALAGVWLPDALAGAQTPLWRHTYGFDLGDVQRFAAAGFHPAELLVASGRFDSSLVRSTLLAHGYRSRGALLARGRDGSIDPTTKGGRLSLSALDRILVAPSRLSAASTTTLLRPPERSLVGDADLAAAALALGTTTSAAIFPAAQVKPVEGVLFVPLATRSSKLLAVGLDDEGPAVRTIKIALVYADANAARADAKVFDAQLPAAALADSQRTHFRDIAAGLHARVVGSRTVLISGTLRPGQKPGIWRGLLERGDLAVLVRNGLPG